MYRSVWYFLMVIAEILVTSIASKLIWEHLLLSSIMLEIWTGYRPSVIILVIDGTF